MFKSPVICTFLFEKSTVMHVELEVIAGGLTILGFVVGPGQNV